MHALKPTNGMGVGMPAHTAKYGVMSPFHAGGAGGGGGAGGSGAAAGCTQDPVWVSSKAPSGQYGVQAPPEATCPTGHAQLGGAMTVASAIGAPTTVAAMPSAPTQRRIELPIRGELSIRGLSVIPDPWLPGQFRHHQGAEQPGVSGPRLRRLRFRS